MVNKFLWLNYVSFDDKISMKCSYFEKYKMNGPWGLGNGCKILQHDALLTHEKALVHKDAKVIWINYIEGKMKPVPYHIRPLEEGNKERVISTMKVAYFIYQKDLSLSKYEKLCKFLMDAKTPYMPKFQIKNMMGNLFFSLMVNESTNRTLEQHLVVYATYVDSKGLGPPISQLMKLNDVVDVKGKTIYDSVNQLINVRGIQYKALKVVSIYGASAMIGHENGLVAFFKNNNPNLITFNCVAYRESLAFRAFVVPIGAFSFPSS